MSLRRRARSTSLKWRIFGLLVPVLVPVALGVAAVLVTFGNTLEDYNRTVSSASAETVAIVDTKAALNPPGVAAFDVLFNNADRSTYDARKKKVDRLFARLDRLHANAAVHRNIDDAERTWRRTSWISCIRTTSPSCSRRFPAWWRAPGSVSRSSAGCVTPTARCEA
jgi:hypothetical protein